MHLHACVRGKLLQSCPTLCDPMGYSLPVSSVHGILQARIQEWVAKPSSRDSSWPREWTQVLCLLHWQVGSLPLVPPGKPALPWLHAMTGSCFLIKICFQTKDILSIILYKWFLRVNYFLSFTRCTKSYSKAILYWFYTESQRQISEHRTHEK